MPRAITLRRRGQENNRTSLGLIQDRRRYLSELLDGQQAPLLQRRVLDPLQDLRLGVLVIGLDAQLVQVDICLLYTSRCV